MHGAAITAAASLAASHRFTPRELGKLWRYRLVAAGFTARQRWWCPRSARLRTSWNAAWIRGCRRTRLRSSSYRTFADEEVIGRLSTSRTSFSSAAVRVRR